MPSVGAAGAPNLSKIESWDTEHLVTAAQSWIATATLWEDSFNSVYQGALRPGGTVWEGQAAEAAQGRSFADLVKVRGLSDTLTEAAGIARRGADTLDYLKRDALDAVEQARGAGSLSVRTCLCPITRCFLWGRRWLPDRPRHRHLPRTSTPALPL